MISCNMLREDGGSMPSVQKNGSYLCLHGQSECNRPVKYTLWAPHRGPSIHKHVSSLSYPILFQRAPAGRAPKDSYEYWCL